MVNLSSTSLYSIDLLLVLDYREQCGFKTVKNLAVAKARKLIFSSLPRIDIPKVACLGWGVNDASGFYKSQFLMVLLPHRSHIYYMVMFWLTMTF